MKKIIWLGSLIVIGMLAFSSVKAEDIPKVVQNGVTTSNVCADANMKDLRGIINWASCTLMATVVPFLFALAGAAFIWGIIQYYMNPENEEKRKKGRGFIVGGLIALFVMTSMWGIIRIFSGTFGTGTVIPSFDNIQQ